MKSTQCSKHVFAERGFNYPCRKKVTVERGGKPYCTIHDPEYIEAKRKALTEEWGKEWAEKEVRWAEQKELRKLQDTALAGCKVVNPDNPMAVALSIEDLYEALKAIIGWMEKWQNAEWNFNGMLIDGRKALAKVDRKEG
ncbi:hypothetical protein LCGC14_1380380 [marine sediment metagenome]|uniref:Uncharacterized protein n=1 Tax=marine sediment metagenome TaxID=412755 RepID=A0A0F9K3B7_9ZZZZ